jgi:hypothetical protein
VPIILGTILYRVFFSECRHLVQLFVTVRSVWRCNFCTECSKSTRYNVNYTECLVFTECNGQLYRVSCFKCCTQHNLSQMVFRLYECFWHSVQLHILIMTSLCFVAEGPKRRPEGGEWEPIKIPQGIWPISQNQPKSTIRKIQRCGNRRGNTHRAMA